MPSAHKEAWQRALMPFVSAWAGGIDIEFTAMYGMRIYQASCARVAPRTGARLHDSGRETSQRLEVA